MSAPMVALSRMPDAKARRRAQKQYHKRPDGFWRKSKQVRGVHGKFTRGLADDEHAFTSLDEAVAWELTLTAARRLKASSGALAKERKTVSPTKKSGARDGFRRHVTEVECSAVLMELVLDQDTGEDDVILEWRHISERLQNRYGVTHEALKARQRQILLLGETVMKAVDEEADDEEGESEEEENESDEESALEAELLTEDDQSEEDRSTEGLDEGPEKLGLNGENPIDAIVF